MHDFTDSFTGDPRKHAGVRLAAYAILINLYEQIETQAHDIARAELADGERVSAFAREDYANAVIWSIVEYLIDSQIDTGDDAFRYIRQHHHLTQWYVSDHFEIDFDFNDNPLPMEAAPKLPETGQGGNGGE